MKTMFKKVSFKTFSAVTLALTLLAAATPAFAKEKFSAPNSGPRYNGPTTAVYRSFGTENDGDEKNETAGEMLYVTFVRGFDIIGHSK